MDIDNYIKTFVRLFFWPYYLLSYLVKLLGFLLRTLYNQILKKRPYTEKERRWWFNRHPREVSLFRCFVHTEGFMQFKKRNKSLIPCDYPESEIRFRDKDCFIVFENKKKRTKPFLRLPAGTFVEFESLKWQVHFYTDRLLLLNKISVVEYKYNDPSFSIKTEYYYKSVNPPTVKECLENKYLYNCQLLTTSHSHSSSIMVDVDSRHYTKSGRLDKRYSVQNKHTGEINKSYTTAIKKSYEETYYLVDENIRIVSLFYDNVEQFSLWLYSPEFAECLATDILTNKRIDISGRNNAFEFFFMPPTFKAIELLPDEEKNEVRNLCKKYEYSDFEIMSRITEKRRRELCIE